MAKRKRTLINATPEKTLDVPRIVTKLCAAGFRRNGELLTLLNTTTIDRQRFSFTFDDGTWFKIFVVCPKCKKWRLKLHKIDRVYRCEDCHGLRRPARLRPSLTALYCQIIRPLKLLHEVEERIFNDKSLTPRQLQRLCEKAETLRKKLPPYILARKSDADKHENLAQNDL